MIISLLCDDTHTNISKNKRKEKEKKKKKKKKKKRNINRTTKKTKDKNDCNYKINSVTSVLLQKNYVRFQKKYLIKYTKNKMSAQRYTRGEHVRFLANLNNSTLGIKKLIQGENSSAIPYIWSNVPDADHSEILRRFEAGDIATIHIPDYGVVGFQPNEPVRSGPFRTRKLHFSGIPRIFRNFASWEATIIMVPLEEARPPQEPQEPFLLNEPLHIFVEPKCVICFEEFPEVLHLPCGHFACCNTCWARWRRSGGGTCPMCRSIVTSTITTLVDAA
jgi:hypothetical protein